MLPLARLAFCRLSRRTSAKRRQRVTPRRERCGAPNLLKDVRSGLSHEAAGSEDSVSYSLWVRRLRLRE